MTKSPEEIKKALNQCLLPDYASCTGCPYAADTEDCSGGLMKDLKEYIRALEAENSELREQVPAMPCWITAMTDGDSISFASGEGGNAGDFATMGLAIIGLLVKVARDCSDVDEKEYIRTLQYALRPESGIWDMQPKEADSDEENA